MCQTNDQMKQEGSNPAVAEVNGGKPVDNKPQEEVNKEQNNQCGLSPSSSIAGLESSGSSSSDFSVDLSSGRRNGHGEGEIGNVDNDHISRRNNGHLESSDSSASFDGLDKPGDALNDSDKERDGGSFEELIKGEDPFHGFWVPPEAENKEDDEENRVAHVDDDEDECGDGGDWGRTLSGFDDGESRSYRSKEEKDKAMEEVKNGKFRTLVRRLLKTVQDEENESWVDVVSSLAWEAASFVKPDISKGKTMDPAGYVKIKCLASGSCRDSQLIKGLVFKKHAAHKHMKSNFEHPRLLLIRGMLEQSSGSSFQSLADLKSEEDKSLMDNLETCHPDVVLVEKSASLALEKLMEKNITLVTDMKIDRLERVAQCTGSPILSSDTMLSQKLKQCDSLHFEKFVEEHSQAEGVKKPKKTLMFLEGSPTHLGCTILLRGTHNEELKKIKYVLQCAVVMAYHFILETCFLLDQEAMFSTVGSCEVAGKSNGDYSLTGAVSLGAHCNSKASTEDVAGDKLDAPSRSVSINPIDIPIAGSIHRQTAEVGGGAPLPSLSLDAVNISLPNATAELRTQNLSLQSQNKSVVINRAEMPANASDLSYISASIEEVVRKDLPTAYPSMQPYLRLGERVSDADEQYLSSEEAKGNDEASVDRNVDSDPMPSGTESVMDAKSTAGEDQEDNQKKDEISTVLDSESILVLMSRRNANRGTICEQDHFSHIKFYKYFDVPLGKFLRENLLNQNSPCSSCKEQPESHYYYYAHHNKQLTIRVKQFPEGIRLPGESEGKLWMWSRCSKCKPEKEYSKKCTRRVLLSRAARGLSFGKFLELGFSNHSSFNRLSSCGHSLHRDFLYFFGLGTLVAMFRYFPVETNNVILPAHKMEYDSTIRGEWLLKDTESVYTKTMLLFTELANYLKKIEPKLSGLTMNINGSVKEFNDTEKMLMAERHEFEENIKNTCTKNSLSVRKLLCLNRLRWELVLEAYIWNRRLQLLSSMASDNVQNKKLSEKAIVEDGSSNNEKQTEGTPPDIQDVQVASGIKEKEAPEKINNVKEPVYLPPASVDPLTMNISSACQQEQESLPIPDENIEISITDNTIHCAPDQKDTTNEKNLTEGGASNNQIVRDRDIPIAADVHDDASFADKNSLCESGLSNTDHSRGQWIWKSFSEIREECRKDLYQSGDLPSFLDSLRLDSPHSPEVLPNLSRTISEEGSRLHIPLGNSEYIVSDFEGEISSIIAAALSQIIDSCHPPENLSDEGFEDALSLSRAASEPSPLWLLSKKSFKESDFIHAAPSMNFAQTRFSSFDGSNLMDSLVSYGSPHRDILVGVDKYLPKGKYSVVCFYSDEFRSLRDHCCPSELDYIASLSRCKIWDAKGGKSKSFFAKTLDDRLVIKEIKRTELESFMKFAANYFKYMKDSVNAGNQTCLAKILGIYQVTVRPTKNGKETKHDLMVMENLSFGRSISCQYDLKGALHARYTDTSDGSGDVLLDQNFVIDMNNSPMYVGQKAKRLLQRAVWNDTGFLNEINVMDYSLLVGVDKQRKELVCGIIDYLRQYTWDKQLESWVKSSLKNVTPTIISPIEYKKRFKKFMDTHFMSVPDRWCSRRSTPCKLCGIDEGGAAGGGDRILSSPSLSSLAKSEDHQELKSSSQTV